MPLNVRRFCTSLLLVIFSFFIATAQTAPTSGDVMRQRISKAKAYIVVKNYNAAIYELENIRRETNDQAVHGVLNVLLMNCYLEQGDYRRAQQFLGDLFNAAKTNRPNAAANFYAAAGQVIKSARLQSERYKSLGLLVSDRNLPVEAVTDLEKMRETLEKVVEQSRTLGKEDKQTSSALALLEEAAGARSLLARDDYDARRWKDEIGDTREMLSNSRSTVINAVAEMPTEAATMQNTVATNTPTSLPQNLRPTLTETVAGNTNPNNSSVGQTNSPAPVFQPVSVSPTSSTAKVEPKPSADLTARNEKTDKPPVSGPVKETSKPEVKTEEPVRKEEAPKVSPETIVAQNLPSRERRVGTRAPEVKEEIKTPEPKTEAAVKTETPNNKAPLNVGSLLEYAVEKISPIYPSLARNLRQTGIVRVEVVIDEDGQVAAVQNLSGPPLLQDAAKNAVKKWRFKPFIRDGQPVKATGFLNFSFNL